MQLAIPITGTRGDVQPYVALGKGLAAAGYHVRIVTHDDFADLVTKEGLDFAPMGGDSRALHAEHLVRRMMTAGSNPFTYLREFARLRAPIMTRLMAEGLSDCRGADLILVTPTAPLVAISIAEKLRVPVCGSAYLPNCPSRHLASCFVPELPPWVPGRSFYNLASSVFTAANLWRLLRTPINRARRDALGLPPFGFLGPPLRRWLHEMPTLHGYSSRIVPRPRDWPDNQYLTGFWFLEAQGWRPPPALERFLNDGPPPVYVGFGSMQNRDAAGFTRLVDQALKRAGLRGILATGWGALGEVSGSDRLFVVRDVPHSWLFPRVSAVVHHGGVGTTAAGLRAGVPSLLVPFFGDQFFWGRRVFELGAGPRAIPRNDLTAERLAEGLKTCVGRGDLRTRARRLGEEIRSEDGISRAVDAVGEIVRRSKHRPSGGGFWS